MLGLPLTGSEEYERKTPVEDRPPAGWFAPMGREMPVPDWLNAGHPFFTGDMPGQVLETATMNSGGASWVVWKVQPRFTLNAATWFYESLIVRTLFERWKRGLPILGEDNRMYVPAITEDGFPIIDSRENDDGSVGALVAMPDPDIAPGDEREAFLKLLGRYVFTAWKGKYNRLRSAPPGADFRRQSRLADYSIGRPRVVTQPLRAGLDGAWVGAMGLAARTGAEGINRSGESGRAHRPYLPRPVGLPGRGVRAAPAGRAATFESHDLLGRRRAPADRRSARLGEIHLGDRAAAAVVGGRRLGVRPRRQERRGRFNHWGPPGNTRPSDGARSVRDYR